jgi:hypothetical protein
MNYSAVYILSNDRHYLSHESQQSHETVELNSLRLQAERMPESYQSVQHDRDSTQHTDAHQNVDRSFDSRKPTEATFIYTQPLR